MITGGILIFIVAFLWGGSKGYELAKKELHKGATIGNLVDQLSICNIRIWMAEDMKRTGIAADMLKATAITNKANVNRNKLIEQIDIALNQTDTGQGSTKMYGK